MIESFLPFILLASLTACDWNQTLQIADRPDFSHEMNPIMGRHPSRKEVNAYFLATSALWIGGYSLASPKWKKRMLWTAIGIEGLAVSNNYFRVGIGLSF